MAETNMKSVNGNQEINDNEMLELHQAEKRKLTNKIEKIKKKLNKAIFVIGHVSREYCLRQKFYSVSLN